MDPLRLTEEDVPGAKLTTSPSKCKASLLHRCMAFLSWSDPFGSQLFERFTSYSVLVVFTCISADRVKSAIKSGEGGVDNHIRLLPKYAIWKRVNCKYK